MRREPFKAFGGLSLLLKVQPELQDEIGTMGRKGNPGQAKGLLQMLTSKQGHFLRQIARNISKLSSFRACRRY